MTSDLQSSLWNATCGEAVDAAALAGDKKVDLVIIGGGYTGCSAALHAAQAGASVCVVEADEIGAGGSGRNVGLVNAGLWMPPRDINSALGQAAGSRLSRILADAPALVFSLIKKYAIACEPVQNGTLHCAHAPAGVADLENRYGQLTEIGAPVELLDRDEAVSRVGSDQVHGALYDPRAGTIQPLAYARGLARAAIEAGAALYQHSPALSVERESQGWLVRTPSGSVRARSLLMATNAYQTPVAGLASPTVIPVHFAQASTRPLPPALLAEILPGEEGCWDTATVMSAWRRDQAGRLIVGGIGQLDHLAGSAHAGWMRRKLSNMFPALRDIDFEAMWYGRIGMTAEHLPKILSIGPDAMACFGYSGRGIGPGTAFGQRLARALLGEGPEVLPIAPVDDHRLAFAGLRRFYYETGATVTHLIKDRW